MTDLESIKQACAQALEHEGDDARMRFASVADPGTVLEMATLIESLLAYVDKQDELTARELARETRHRIGGAGAEGGV